MARSPKSMEPSPEAKRRALLVHLDLLKVYDRHVAEGAAFDELAAGIACFANEVIATEHNQATASAWFLAMAENAAQIAADEMRSVN